MRKMYLEEVMDKKLKDKLYESFEKWFYEEYPWTAILPTPIKNCAWWEEDFKKFSAGFNWGHAIANEG